MSAYKQSYTNTTVFQFIIKINKYTDERDLTIWGQSMNMTKAFDMHDTPDKACNPPTFYHRYKIKFFTFFII